MSLGPQPYTPPLKPPFRMRLFRWYVRFERWVVAFFRSREPVLRHTLLPFLLLSVVLYIRHPATNYIFDEQEALLANPYVNEMKGLGYWDAIYVDFWGLPPDASIGSYRPLPNFVWRATWGISKHPFFHHLYNLLFHALNGALLSSFAYAVTKRRSVGWLSGAVFVTAAVITEAVSGIVGIADVLGGLGALLALNALRLSGPWMVVGVFMGMVVGLFSKESAMVCVPLLPAAALLTAPMLHPQRPARWARTVLSFLVAAGAFVAYVELRREWFPSPMPSELSVALPENASALQVVHRELLVWFRQAPLPKDPLNNPLAGEHVDFAHRVSGALRVYWRGFTQVLFPHRLSGDYSAPQEPVPTNLYGWESVAGGLLMVVPLLTGLGLLFYVWIQERRAKKQLVAPGALSLALQNVLSAATGGSPAARAGAPLLQLERRPWQRKQLEIGGLLVWAALVALGVEFWMLKQGDPTFVKLWPYSSAVLALGFGFLVRGWRGQKRAMQSAGPWPWRFVAPVLVALGLVWMVVSYFPHSNIPVVLPTVRAERFWYFPVIGTSLAIAVLLGWFAERMRGVELWRMPLGVLVPAAFFSVQVIQAYAHSMDYEDDLAFWRATKNAVPRSAKAHLNYSVMVGARGDLQTRLEESKIAMSLAPEWAMASIYTGDTLCRMHRAHEAWPYYAKGFDLGPNDRSLIALALQCMYDEKTLLDYETELREIADRHDGSWIRYLGHDTLDNHERHGGVDPQYRPRGYNEGPKEETSEESSADGTDSHQTVEEVVESVFPGWHDLASGEAYTARSTDLPIPPSALESVMREYAPEPRATSTGTTTSGPQP